MPIVYVSRRLGRASDIAHLLEQGGCSIRLGSSPADAPAVTRFSPDEIARDFGDVDAIVVGTGETISDDVVAGARRLSVVCCYYIGTEFIDVAACTARSVVVGFGAVPDNYLGVAEAIVMLATALMKELPAKHTAMRDGGWGVADAGRMVAGSTIGMIGLGNVGRALARRLAGWDCRVICYDPYVKPPDADAYGVALVDLDTLLRSADVVSVQATLTAETLHMIGARELGLMRRDAYLVNTARGPLVDEAALRLALDEGWIAGAAVDVWEGRADARRQSAPAPPARDRHRAQRRPPPAALRHDGRGGGGQRAARAAGRAAALRAKPRCPARVA